MYIQQVSLNNFRNYVEVTLEPAEKGITLLQGNNGAGKTNVLEAINYFSTMRSFRGSPTTSLVRSGEQQAILRATGNTGGRNVLLEAELNLVGKARVRLNRQPVRRNEDLLGVLLSTVFSPDDIGVVKGGPQSRREYLDDLLVGLHPKHGAAHAELERVLRQRNALLRSAHGALRPSMAGLLDVWDAKLAAVGELIAEARQVLTLSLQPEVARSYRQLTRKTTGSGDRAIVLRYEPSWQGPLVAALHLARSEDVRRGMTSVGPQRDDLFLSVGALAARTQASQGEQRSLALALRLGGHSLLADRHGSSPLLLLDDIFSELDPWRSGALASCLPEAQTLLTAAGAVPDDLPVARRFRVGEGAICLAEGLTG